MKSNTRPYEKVGMLMLRWTEELNDDPELDHEVMQLRYVFEDDLQFDVDEVRLTATSVHPQIQLEQSINDLIAKYDRPNCRHLLIVYYTGHACKFPCRPNDLIFAGTDKPNVVPAGARFAPMVSWKDAERLLINYSESDTLIILDCCYAGTAFSESRKSHNDRVVEVMVATAREEYTARPGKFSFTTAMVKAVKALRADGNRSLSTPELIQRILREAPRSAASRVEKANLHPLVLGQSEKHIVLAPPMQALDQTSASAGEVERPTSRMESYMSMLRLALETG